MTLASIIILTRDALNEPVPRFWSDAELIRYLNRGIRDAWRQISMVNQNYQFTLSTAVTLAAGADVLSNVPTDVSVVLNLEPADMVSNPLVFVPKSDYADADFQNARRNTQDGQTQDAGQVGRIFYMLAGAGAPVAAPTIHIAPRVNAEVTLALAYRPVIGAELGASSLVPLPGELDMALAHWAIAHALGRQRGSAEPDGPRMLMYQAELDKALPAIDPRDETGDDVVVAMFEEYI